ncbi:MAG TPA: GrpB family protein, partial [Anaerolineales bacterium]
MMIQTQDSKTAYDSERDRLTDALGMVVDGGIVEAIQHIGATSVPGLYGSPCMDIGLAFWPFPLEAGHTSRLNALGYNPVSGYE